MASRKSTAQKTLLPSPSGQFHTLCRASSHTHSPPVTSPRSSARFRSSTLRKCSSSFFPNGLFPDTFGAASSAPCAPKGLSAGALGPEEISGLRGNPAASSDPASAEMSVAGALGLVFFTGLGVTMRSVS